MVEQELLFLYLATCMYQERYHLAQGPMWPYKLGHSLLVYILSTYFNFFFFLLQMSVIKVS